MKVHSLMRDRAHPVYTIDSNQSVEDAVNLMTAKRASALIVTEKNRPAGIFSERDVFRYYQRDKAAVLSETTLQHAMTEKLIVATSEDDISKVMAMMMKANIKHIPILEKKAIIGMLTLTDIFENQIKSLADEVNQLKDYIEDLHEAVRD